MAAGRINRNPPPFALPLTHTLDADGGVSPESVHRNFQSIKTALESASPVMRGQVTETVALVTGNNDIHSPVKNPIGRLTVFQDAAVTIIDVGVNGDVWTVNASGPCNARFHFH